MENKLYPKIPIIGNILSRVTDVFPQSFIQGATPFDTIEGFSFQNKVRNSIIQSIRENPARKFVLIGYSQGNFIVEDIVRKLPKDIQGHIEVISLASFTDFQGLGTRGIFNVGSSTSQAQVRVQYLLREGDIPNRIKFLPGVAAPNNRANLPSVPGGFYENHHWKNYASTDNFLQLLLNIGKQ